MTRKIRRTENYEFTLEIKNEAFISPPRLAQRNWLLNRVVAELAEDLASLDRLSAGFAAGVDAVQVQERSQTMLADTEIMEDWQIPLMKAMADLAAGSHGDVLEIGFGRGISSSFIQECRPRSHTIVECNPSVIDRFYPWKEAYSGRQIQMLPGKWQDVTAQLDLYDGIFFHTFPLDEEEYIEQVLNSVTYAEHFFPTAAAHLRPGGVFTYMTNEIDSLSRGHQRLIFRYFSSFCLQVLNDLAPPDDTQDTWWANSMVVVKAVK